MTNGNLPFGWQRRQLGECAEFINGRAYAQAELLDSGTPVLRIQNLNGSDRWYYSTLKLPDEKYCQDGDLLYAWSASFGPYRFVGPKSIFHYHIWRVLPGDELDKDFAFHLLEHITNEVKSKSHGVTMQHMTKGGIEAWPIALPPLPEQRRIAEILDRADEVRVKRRAALAQLDSLTQSIFIDLFGNPSINPKGWRISQLRDLCERVIDCPHATPIYATGRTKYPCIRSSDIQNGELMFADTRYVEHSEYEKRIARGRPQVGDVVYCREGARFGNAALVAREISLCLGQRMMLFRSAPNVATGEYLWAFLTSSAAYRQAANLVGGSASPHVNIRDIVTFRVPVPPIDLQREFARRVSAVEKLKMAQRVSLAEMGALFDSLHHRAFSGEL